MVTNLPILMTLTTRIENKLGNMFHSLLISRVAVRFGVFRFFLATYIIDSCPHIKCWS